MTIKFGCSSYSGYSDCLLIFTTEDTAGTIDAEYLNHTSDTVQGDSFGYLTSQLRVRYGTANNIAFEDIKAQTGSGFLFAADAFAKMITTSDSKAFELHANASIDNAATLEALAKSARQNKKIAVSLPN